MASNSICTSCLRGATRQFRPQTLRQFTSSARNQLSSSKPAYSAPPSAEKARPPPPPPQPKDPTFDKIAASIRLAAPISTTEPYIAYGSTEDLFAECTRQADYTVPQALMTPPELPPVSEGGEHLGVGRGWWLEPKTETSAGGLGLDATFNSWAQVTMLHMYILTVRLRAFPKEVVGPWHQNLLDHFFYAAEDKMVMWHGYSSRPARNKALKDLWLQWRGVQLGYDEGLIKGDAVFAAAVWRNVFKGREDVDIRDLARVTGYVRRELGKLGRVGDDVVYEGRVKFGDPRDQELGFEGKEARLMKGSFKDDDLKALMDAKVGAKK